MKYRVLLRALVPETRETTSGQLLEEEHRGEWQCTRLVRLPFVPRPGIEIVDTREPPIPHAGAVNSAMGLPALPDDRSHCKIVRVQFDVATSTFYCPCDWNVLFDHESTAEKLAESFPGWKFRWISYETAQ